jgi:hypothetical protein
MGYWNKLVVLITWDIIYRMKEKNDLKWHVNFAKILGIINQIFKPSPVSKHIRIQIYKTLDQLTLFYVTEA